MPKYLARVKCHLSFRFCICYTQRKGGSYYTMDVSHKDLIFSFRQNMILRKINLFGVSQQALWHNKNLQFLRQYKLLERIPNSADRYTLSEKARMYLRYKSQNRFRFWIPVIISIVALFGGYDVYTNPLLEQLLRGIANIVKTISEILGAFL